MLIKKEVFRVLDANLNRASEGLRVLEDTFRFIENNKSAYENIRKIRHEINKALAKFYPQLIKARDTVTDEGSRARECNFNDITVLKVANFKRVEQALRVLEEYSRLVSGQANREFKKIRFKMYLLEKNVLIKDRT